jgi:DNA polymerase V
MKTKIFAIVDCNNFYVSCERLFNPKLKNKPVAVLSNNDGIIIARSDEVKSLGVPMGAPVFKFEEVIRENKVTLFSSNYSLYGDISWRVMETLKTFTDNIEIYSIDEAFLEISSLAIHDYVKFGQEIRERVRKWTGIPVSVGIARTKTLAKLANRFAKKEKTNNGVCVLLDSDIDEKLKKIEIEDVWGVGFRNAPKLRQMQVNNALDLKKYDSKIIRKKYSVLLERTLLELNGISCIPISQSPAPKQSIASTRSFGRYITSLEEMEQALSTYVARAMEKLRKQNSIVGAFMIFIRTNYKSKIHHQYSNSLVTKLNSPTLDTSLVTKLALAGLKKIFKSGYRYQKAGVILFDIAPEQNKQYQLGNASSQIQMDKANQMKMQTIDKINSKFGSSSIFLGSEGVQKDWRMKNEKRSPSYTMSWYEILKVK